MTIAGLGGPQFAAAGGRLIDDYRGLAVTGLTEATGQAAAVARDASAGWSTSARDERPDALVVIDFPDFNLRLARGVKKLGIPVIYYISPQIWAWRPGRLKTIRAVADRVLVIFPFEEAIYRDGGVPVEFVGHPLVDLVQRRRRRERRSCRGSGLDPTAPTVAVLPGSRPNEVSGILPDLLRRVPPDSRAACPACSSWSPARRISTIALFDGRARAGRQSTCRRGRDRRGAGVGRRGADRVGDRDRAGRAARHADGRRLSAVAADLSLGRRFVKVDTFAMVNLIAGERHRAGADSGRVHAGGGGRRGDVDADRSVARARRFATALRARARQARRIRRQPARGGGDRAASGGQQRTATRETCVMMTAVAVTLRRMARASAPHATVLLPADLGELSREARAIARGRVVAVDAQWTDDRRDDRDRS